MVRRSFSTHSSSLKSGTTIDIWGPVDMGSVGSDAGREGHAMGAFDLVPGKERVIEAHAVEREEAHFEVNQLDAGAKRNAGARVVRRVIAGAEAERGGDV